MALLFSYTAIYLICNTLAQQFPLVFPTKIINNVNIICHLEEFLLQDNVWRIVIPASMINNIIWWYHLVLGHPGSQRLYDTINAQFFYPGLSTLCKDYRCPDDCDMIKNQGQQYGHLAPREVGLGPWHTILVDLIGPWKATINKQYLEFKALTIMDRAKNLLEIVWINNKTS